MVNDQAAAERSLGETIRKHVRNPNSALAIIKAVDQYAATMRSFRARQVEIINRLQKNIAALETAAAERERLLSLYISRCNSLQETINMHWEGNAE
jgi:hypothetical protein